MAKLAILLFSVAGAITAAVAMLLLSPVALAGVYEGAADMMIQWHAFYSLSFGGIVAGMLEAAAITFAGAALLAWLNNLFVGRMA